jgi:translation initiation factor IF-2
VTDAERENTLHLILKAPDAGSLEALTQILAALKLEKPSSVSSKSFPK